MAAITIVPYSIPRNTDVPDGDNENDDENDEEIIIAEAKWYLPAFKNREEFTCGEKIAFVILLALLVAVSACLFFIFLPALICISCRMRTTVGIEIRERLYLTQSSIVYRRDGQGNHENLAYHRNFNIDLENIIYIKSISRVMTQTAGGKFEVRAHDLVTFQVKEDSTQKIRYGTDSPSVTCCSWTTIDDSVDSFAFLCHNGDEFNLCRQSKDKWC